MKNWRPEEVTTDKAKALIGAVEDLLPYAAHDTSVYANNRGRVRSLPAEGTAETDARFAAAQVLYERVPADTTASTSSCRARTASGGDPLLRRARSARGRRHGHDRWLRSFREVSTRLARLWKQSTMTHVCLCPAWPRAELLRCRTLRR